MEKFLNSKWFDFFIICIRFSFIRLFVSYGWSKLTDSQFGLSAEFMMTPIKDLSLYQIGWYLFDQQPFKYAIGISQFICAALLLFNRTVIIGTIMFMIITLNILIIDETIMPDMLRYPFRFRLIIYLGLACLILYHHRDRFIPGFKKLTEKYSSTFTHKFWWFLLVPIVLLGIELISAFVFAIYRLITDYDNFIAELNLIQYSQILSNLFGSKN